MTNKEKTPLYQTIFDEIVRKISDSTYPVGSYLPSEAVIQKTYDVSRITARRVLSDLESEGYTKKIKGKGSVVLPKKKYSDLYQLTGFTEDAKSNGPIEPGEDIFYLKRLRLYNGRIYGVFSTYISMRFNLPLEPEQFDSETSLYDFYEQNGVKVTSASETIEAVMSTPEIRKEMFLDKDEPIFLRERITYNDLNVPIEYSKNHHRANQYKYVVRLHR